MAGLMEFGLLGPLVVRSGGTELTIKRGSQRALLAALLLQANQIVSTAAIAEVLWQAQPPPSELLTIRNHVSRLRRSMGQAGPERIITHPRGYLIRVGDTELDLTRFERLLATARAAARNGFRDQAAAQAGEALSVWRGEPLADVESDTLTLREAPRLTELRLQAAETLFEARLELGDHAGIVAEAGHLAAAHPLREHVQALLMLALYRCGRQAEALAAYQNLRRALVEELGAEPAAELQSLHQQILNADPALDPPSPENPAPAAGQAGAGESVPAGAVPARQGAIGSGPPDAPRQLPAAVADFTGRAAELQALTQILERTGNTPGTAVISAIGGTAGVGKTALAIHFAHQAAHRFPDGQLYVNLRGFDPGGSPATPGEAIRRFLDAVGVPPERIPASLEAQEGLYRSLLARRRMLVVLDNARDEQQVRPLLPASPGSLVLVTSRRQLTGLAAASGARLLNLDVFTGPEARQMLAARIGSARAAAEPGPIADIADLCACLPLALAVAAARAAARPDFPLAALAEGLRDTASRLDALDAGDPAASVRTVFSWSYQQLSPEAARMFRLLGLHPGPDISGPAAASLAGLPRARSRQSLDELTRAHLITEHFPGRYVFHNLLRAYATDQSAATDSQPDRRAATVRMLGHYLHTGYTASELMRTGRGAISLARLTAGVTPEHLTDHQQALAWFEAEHQVLIAAISLAAGTGLDVYAWQIPWIMADFLYRRGHWREWVSVEATAVAAATRLGDSAGQTLCRRHLGVAHSCLAEYDQARTQLAASLELSRQLGDRDCEARTELDLSVACERQGQHAEALGHAEQAFRLWQATNQLEGQAQCLNNIGYIQALLGDFARAQATCRRALSLNRELGDRHFEANTWDSLGYTEHHLGRHSEAAFCYTQALSLFREIGDRYYEAKILTHLGDMHLDAQDHDAARVAWQQAMAILDELQHPDMSEVRAKLCGLAPDSAVSPGSLARPGGSLGAA